MVGLLFHEVPKGLTHLILRPSSHPGKAKLSAASRSNAHCARPSLNLSTTAALTPCATEQSAPDGGR